MKILLLLVSILCAEKMYGSAYVKDIVSIYDGDTFRCNIAQWPPIIGDSIEIRVRGIDTPEMKDSRPDVHDKAVAARQFVVEKLMSGKKIVLKNMGRDKFFRIDATVFVDGQNLADSLIVRGLAKTYDGGTKSAW